LATWYKELKDDVALDHHTESNDIDYNKCILLLGLIPLVVTNTTHSTYGLMHRN